MCESVLVLVFVLVLVLLSMTANFTFVLSGHYTCEAVNALGRDECTANLSITEKPQVKYDSKYDNGIEGRAKYNTKINTTVTGRPKPNVTWIKVGQSFFDFNATFSISLTSAPRSGLHSPAVVITDPHAYFINVIKLRQ